MYIQGSPSRCGWLEIPTVPQVEKEEHHHCQASLFTPSTATTALHCMAGWGCTNCVWFSKIIRGNKCDHDCMYLENTAHIYEPERKHRGCHKGQSLKRWCCCTATDSNLAVVVVYSVAARVLLKSWGRVGYIYLWTNTLNSPKICRCQRISYLLLFPLPSDNVSYIITFLVWHESNIMY